MVFNSCASLVSPETYKEAEDLYNKMLSEGKDPVQMMFDLQMSLQQELADKLPKYNKPAGTLETMGEILDYLQRQDDAIADETRELYTALGEMSRGEKEASAIFKPWKQRHDEARSRRWEDISNEDKLEIMFEMIDQIHFVLVKLMTLRIDAKDMFVLYYLKQQENIRRYNSGY
jgi:hypothetical protein